MTEQKSKYEILKDLLIGDELAHQQSLDRELRALEEEIKVKQKLEQNMEPVLAERFMRLKRDFPREFGAAFTKTLQKQAEENPQEIIAALSPILAPLIDQHLENRWSKFKSKIGFGKKIKKEPTDLYQEPVVYEENEDAEDDAHLNDIFVVENASFEMIGYRSKYEGNLEDNVKEYLVAAIKDMVKQAVNGQDQGLNWIDFDNYIIYLITFKRLSVACTVGGVPDKQYKMDLEDQVMEFAKDILPELDADNPAYNQKLTERFLKNHFHNL